MKYRHHNARIKKPKQRRARGVKSSNNKGRINEENINKQNRFTIISYNNKPKNIINYFIKRNNNENIIKKYGMALKQQLMPSKYRDMTFKQFDYKCNELSPSKTKIKQTEIIFKNNIKYLLSLASYDFNIYQIV